VPATGRVLDGNASHGDDGKSNDHGSTANDFRVTVGGYADHGVHDRDPVADRLE